ncbi:DMT family transporter [Primorskyibacter flagellatus]|uniref:EamA-like transporter family protein n=1 Tax=Primorskyibacter flagellatus TaxID=1387277 RepID=A0A1W2E4X2_9RHOB|nr:DMT family transporter [Primorskyibacter flagellatus]SMD04833.1 EamA-like transporter family protein [Primorskyibacter flagellatus]
MFIPTTANPALAALLTLCASAFAAGTTLLAKAIGTGALGDPLHPLQISHGRFAFAFLAIAVTYLATQSKIHSPEWTTHAARSVFGWGGVTLMFAAAAFIPLADATAISFLNPVFGMIFAIIFLREKVGPVRWTAALIALIGMAILLRPAPDSFRPATLLALAAAVTLGAELIFIKRLSGREPVLQILFINNAIGLGIASLAVIAVWHPPSWQQWVALAGIGLLMASAQFCFVNAMARADASFVAPFFYASLVFATLYDFVVFRVTPDAISVTGATVIMAGAALLAWREARIRT